MLHLGYLYNIEKGKTVKKSYSIYGALLLCVTPQIWAADGAVPDSATEKLSYSIGASIGKNLKKESPEIDLDLLLDGFKASFAGKSLKMSEPDMRSILNTYQTQLRQKAITARQLALLDNKKAGDAYLEQNKAKPGVQVMSNGVQFRVLQMGEGRKPLESDMVVVNYRGALVNGTEFDATEPGKPATLKVSALIAGWKQALITMPVGSKWELVIPSQLAYGERGVGSDIGPNEVLVFQVELLAIK